MKKVSFYYLSNLVNHSIQNAGGTVTLQFTEEEADLFKRAVNDVWRVYDYLDYFREKLPQSLADKICCAITDDIEKVNAKDHMTDRMLEKEDYFIIDIYIVNECINYDN